MARHGKSANDLVLVALLLCSGVPAGWSGTSDQQPRDKPPVAKPAAARPASVPPAAVQPAAANPAAANPAAAKPAPEKPKADPRESDRQQMRGLDEQIQEVKSDVLSIAAELNQLEEKLLYPSGTQLAVFVAIAKDDTMRLDAVRLQIDGQAAAEYVYSAKELEALRKGGVQRLYVGNVATGDHQLEVKVEGKREGGADFERTEHFAFKKEVKPKLVGLTFGGAGSGNPAIALGEW